MIVYIYHYSEVLTGQRLATFISKNDINLPEFSRVNVMPGDDLKIVATWGPFHNMD